MYRIWLYFIVSLIIFIYFSSNVSAVTINISNTPTLITNEPFDFNVSIDGASAGTNYLRVDLYKDGSSNYFGETYNNSSWYGGSEGKQYLPITIISGQTWTSSIQGKIGNPSATEFPGSGLYKLKVRRYTSSGNPSSSDQQIPQDIEINYEFPTPTPTPTEEPIPTDEPTPTNIPEPSSTPTKAPTPTKTATPTPKPTVKPTIKPTNTSTQSGQTQVNLPPSILGTSSAEITEIPPASQNSKTEGFSFNKLLTGAGVMVLILSGLLFYTFIAKRKLSNI